ncbi:hypothetical protein AVE30378_02512 [Achromobacter veterisilvae]|uniref:Phage-related protein n=1 Tax=Achromobacter veterisilvae TaxID=2069367 RepID=A0A446CH55_9BURK|nr:hypothetical protein [Achromobacter veterisilvae]SSW67224.1 hypothetical protein AVE30378_02512 [Achromobacter veterisilvae]
MKERPILFNAAMVRAVLAGDKTQTRRAVKLPHHNPLGQWEPTTVGGPGVRFSDGTPAPSQAAIWHTRTGDAILCPYGQPGDRLWIRETVRAEEQPGGLDGVRYLADNAFLPIENASAAADAWLDLHRYRGKRGATAPPIHMPRWACRLMLEVTRVRVERLQAINHMDALAEGVGLNPSAADLAMTTPAGESMPRAMFRALWEQINGAGAWDTNPWVWVVEFRVQAPVAERETVR